VEGLLDAAATHYGAGRLDEAAGLYVQAERLRPTDIRATYSLAVIDIRRSRFADARRRLLATLRRQPDHFAAQHNLGVATQALGDWQASASAYARALELRPDAAETRFSLAIVLAVLGREDEAIDGYRVLASTPAVRPRALTRMAILRPGTLTDAEVAQLRDGAADGAVDVTTRTGLLFALGGVLEARGEDDAAFAAFSAGNALKHQTLEAGAPARRPEAVEGQHAQSMALLERLFTREFLQEHQGGGDSAHTPIFIVGMPRSGSTLIEQILASHPRIGGLGESLALSTVLDEAWPYAPGATPEANHFARLADRYLAELRRRGWKGGTRPVDKTLENHLHIGMIHLMFPKAVILHSVRDPVDTCLACYRQLFASGAETLYDLRQIGAEYVRYWRMMEHWRAVLPGRVVDVSYEALVAAPETEIPRLVTQACDLPWSPRCLRFHATSRPIITASAAQVRQPMFGSSVERWRRYERFLGPLFEALGSYAPADAHRRSAP